MLEISSSIISLCRAAAQNETKILVELSHFSVMLRLPPKGPRINIYLVISAVRQRGRCVVVVVVVYTPDNQYVHDIEDG